MKIELLPCPFCARAALIRAGSSDFIVGCDSPGCPGEYAAREHDFLKAMIKWNTRKP